MSGLDPTSLSIVVQGPVVRGDGPTATAAVLASLRRAFPGAELILSTWHGSDTAGLDVDSVVTSADPGIGGMKSNVNRQIVSSRAGIARATRPYVLKTRTDILFFSGSVLPWWNVYTERAAYGALFRERVLVSSLFTRRTSLLAPYTFHPGDWVFLGRRDDLTKLFSVPLQQSVQATVATPEPVHRLLQQIHGGQPHLAIPEQYLWVTALRAAGHPAPLRYWFDLTHETLVRSELAFAQNLVVLDAVKQWDIMLPKYPTSGRLLHDYSLMAHTDWLELYELYSLERSPIDAAFAEKRWRRMLEYSLHYAPQHARDETAGGGGLRHRWVALSELAQKMLGREHAGDWLPPLRTGIVHAGIPPLAAGASLVRPLRQSGPATMDVRIPESITSLLPDDAITLPPDADCDADLSSSATLIAPAFSLGIPVHERRLELMQQMARRVHPLGTAYVDFPYRPDESSAAYWQNDLRGWHRRMDEEMAISTLTPLRADATQVQLVVDDHLLQERDGEQRVWVTLRASPDVQRPRRLLLDPLVAARLAYDADAHTPPAGWAPSSRQPRWDLRQGCLDQLAIEAGERVDVMWVDASRVLPGPTPLLNDDRRMTLLLDVANEWWHIERALRVAIGRPRTVIVARDLATRQLLQRLAPEVPCHLMRNGWRRADGAPMADVLVDLESLAQHPRRAVYDETIRLLEARGVRVQHSDHAAGDALRSTLVLSGARPLFVDAPTPWILQYAASTGGTLIGYPDATLSPQLPSFMANSDVVLTDVPVSERHSLLVESLVQLPDTLGSSALAALMQAWVEDESSRLVSRRSMEAALSHGFPDLWTLVSLQGAS